ncbi:hypothetical protein Tco_0758542 [Tanacetum coccineum]
MGVADDQPKVKATSKNGCKIAKAEKPSLSFDELMSTPIDFSGYLMNNLKIDNLTHDLLVRPAFNLLKGTCKSRVELEYNIEECRQVILVNYFLNNDLDYPRERSLSKKYTTSTTKTKVAKYGIPRIEDMVPSTVLHDIASNLRMDYLPKRRWSNLNRQRSRIMIKAINKMLLERRLMRNLEKFVGRRDYGEDFKLLERTI